MSQKLLSSNQRLRLYGKPATKDEIAQEVARLLLGDERRKIKPLGITQIAKNLNLERITIYRYKDLAIDLGLIQTDKETGKAVLPEKPQEEIFKKFTNEHKILENPLVSDWWQDLQTRKGGKPIGVARLRILQIEKICNTLKMNPESLLISHEQTEKICRNYLQMYKENKIVGIVKKKGLVKIEYIQYFLACSVADFCGFHHMTWKKGVGGIMSRKVVGHGQYADIRLTKDELETANKFILKKYGLDSDVYRWFWVGVESACRFTAMYNMDLNYVKHKSEKTGNVTFFMTAIESKTSHIKGGKWTKYITRSETQKSIELLKSRGGTKILEQKLSQDKFTTFIQPKMLEIYKHLGKSGYFLEHPTHALRHISAHYWLSQTKYNYGAVAKICGWNTVDELRKSYGEMPPEVLLNVIDDI